MVRRVLHAFHAFHQVPSLPPALHPTWKWFRERQRLHADSLMASVDWAGRTNRSTFSPCSAIVSGLGDVHFPQSKGLDSSIGLAGRTATISSLILVHIIRIKYVSTF